MSEPVDFCKRRMNHLKDKMDEEDLDLVYLVNDSRGGLRFKRIIDTPSGSALIVPRDGVPKLFVFSVDYISSKEESWIQVEEIKERKKAKEQIVGYANIHLSDSSRTGASLSSFNNESYTYNQKNIKGQIIDISNSLIPEVFYGLYPEEIKYQRDVSKLADIGCSVVRESLQEGITEYELAAAAEYEMRRHGAEVTSFDTIISTGYRSAYSHGWPTERRLKKNEFVLVDLGPQVKGYASDETRTFLLGSDSKKERMLNAMDKAVEEVVSNIKPGVSCKELDSISRKVLKEHGFPDYPHSLGHPISGFIVPNLSSTSEHVLKPGMLFTVEPGIYLPGYGGVRMEENIVVTEKGFEQLTKSPRIF
ncbi:M24 family metallopeptidase [Candidatus Bathyarchaeota archaeon]|nr:M24 family metallopeptidase [Candidatus Bathyarchaeota archaeon]